MNFFLGYLLICAASKMLLPRFWIRVLISRTLDIPYDQVDHIDKMRVFVNFTEYMKHPAYERDFALRAEVDHRVRCFLGLEKPKDFAALSTVFAVRVFLFLWAPVVFLRQLANIHFIYTDLLGEIHDRY